MLEQVRISVASRWGRNGVCPENQLLGETHLSEERGSVSVAGEGLQVTACVPGAVSRVVSKGL